MRGECVCGSQRPSDIPMGHTELQDAPAVQGQGSGIRSIALSCSYDLPCLAESCFREQGGCSDSESRAGAATVRVGRVQWQ